MVSFRFSGFEIPIVTRITKAYKTVVTIRESIIPRGKFLLGFFTSSAKATTLVNPPKEIKTKLAVENKGINPFSKNGKRFSVCTDFTPQKI